MTQREALIKKGLSDEKIIADLIEKLNFFGINNIKKLRSEMYDKINYMCRHYMDRTMRIIIDYDALPDLEALKNTVICYFEFAPITHSSFIDNHIAPYWRVMDYHIDDVIFLFDENTKDEERDKFLMQEIPLKSNVQFKIGIFPKEKGCQVAFVINHMLMDGGGVKSSLSDIIRNYNNLKNNGESPVNFAHGTRSYKAVYKDMSPEDKKTAKKLFKNVSVKCKYTLPFDVSSVDNRKGYVKQGFKGEDFSNLKAACKKLNVSVNDAFVAAYAKSAYEMCEIDDSNSISISTAVDLRRYMKDFSDIGYTNHVNFFPCVIQSGGTVIDILKKVNASNTVMKQDKFLGLHGIPLLNIGYSTMIYAQAEVVVKLFYNNANLAVSNVGLLKSEDISFCDAKAHEVFIIGATKNKPCSIATVVTLGDTMNFTFATESNEKDYKMLNRFADMIVNNLKTIAKEK